MPDFVYRFTSLPRPLDPTYPTNIAISILMILTMVAFFAFYMMVGISLITALISAAMVGIGVFLTWAIAREIDPDNEFSAFAAAGIAMLGSVAFGVPDLLAMVFILLATRILNRTVGPPATIFDSSGLLIIAGLLAMRGNWIYPMIAANVYVLDSQLDHPNRRQIMFGLAAVAVMGIAFFLDGWQGPTHPLTVPALFAIALTLILVTMTLLSTDQLDSKTDLTDESLSVVRITAAQIMVLLTCVFIAVWHGAVGVIGVFPLWATLLGVSAYRLLDESFVAPESLNSDEKDVSTHAATD